MMLYIDLGNGEVVDIDLSDDRARWLWVLAHILGTDDIGAVTKKAVLAAPEALEFVHGIIEIWEGFDTINSSISKIDKGIVQARVVSLEARGLTQNSQQILNQQRDALRQELCSLIGW
jgi:hypothetical protein